MDEINKEETIECSTKINESISSLLWKKCFPSNFGEYEYDKSKNCTFNLIIDIIKKVKNIDFTIHDIKKDLYNEYLRFLPLYKDKIIEILIEEGKKTLGDQVKAGTLSFQMFLYTESYFLTNLDLWILLNKYEIPSFFISNKNIIQTNKEYTDFICYGKSEDDFVFILVPPPSTENIPKYKLIKSDDNKILFSLSQLKENCFQSLIQTIDRKINIEDFIKNYVKKQLIIKKRVKLILVNDDNELTKTQKRIVIKKNKTKKKLKIIDSVENNI
jgi:hypothetical protein